MRLIAHQFQIVNGKFHCVISLNYSLITCNESNQQLPYGFTIFPTNKESRSDLMENIKEWSALKVRVGLGNDGALPNPMIAKIKLLH